MMEAERQRNWIPRDVPGFVSLDPHVQRGINSLKDCELCSVNVAGHRRLSIDRTRVHALNTRQEQLRIPSISSILATNIDEK